MFGSTENRRYLRSVLTRPYTRLVLLRTEGKWDLCWQDLTHVWFYREQKVSEICVDKTIHMFGPTENRRYLRSVLTRPYICLVLQRTEAKWDLCWQDHTHVWSYREQKVSEICVDKTIHMFGSTEKIRYVRSVLTRPYTCLVLQRTEGKWYLRSVLTRPYACLVLQRTEAKWDLCWQDLIHVLFYRE